MDDPQSPTPTPYHLPTIGRRHKLFWRVVDQYWELFLILTVMLKLALPMISSRDFWYDESISGVIIQQNWHNFFRLLMENPANTQQPLYHILAKVLSAPFGHSAAAIRGVSLLFGLALVIGVYLFCRELFNRTAATLAAFIAATSPFVLQYATEARMYSLMGAVVIFAAIFQTRAVKTGRWVDHVLWGILMALAVLAHYLALIFIFLLLLAYPWQVANKKNQPTEGNGILATARQVIGRLPKIGIALICGTIVFAPWLPGFIIEHVSRRNSWIPKPQVTDLTATVAIFLFGSFPGSLGMPSATPLRIALLNELTQYFVLPVLAIITTWLIAHNRRWRPGSALCALLTFGSLSAAYLLMFGGSYFMVSRFLFPAALFLAALLGAFLAELRWGPRLAAIAAFAFLCTFRMPYDLPTGFTQLARRPPDASHTLYLLNALDFNVAKFYFPKNSLALYNISNPAENFSGWETIEPFRRILTADEITHNREGLVVLNADHAPPENSFLDRFILIGQFDNLKLYRPR